VAVLAAVALVAYRRHLRSGRIVKAEQFVSEIKGRQELYQRRYGVYAGCPTFPLALAAAEPEAKQWDPATILAEWKDLGARPPGGVSYLIYNVVASSAPGHAASGDSAALGIRINPSAADRGPWYYVVALGDLDGDGCAVGSGINATNCTVITTTSQSSAIIVRNRGE
jgi:type II secretory pathway pseudopilin PulG